MEKVKEYPDDFRCPISMELMKDPVTICTGVTYERSSIQKWFFTYKKKTCPATMQSIHNFDVTPNHTLQRLIQAWLHDNNKKNNSSDNNNNQESPPRPSFNHKELVSLLSKLMDSSPFKVTSLKKLRSVLQTSEEAKDYFIRCGGVEVVAQILVEEGEASDFVTFRSCEEALAVLHQLPIQKEEDQDHDKTKITLSKPESMRSIATVLQRGSAEARLHAVTIFQKMAKTDYNWEFMIQDRGIDFFKSLLELVSDELCNNTKASSCALEVLIDILSSSKKSRLRAIEAGAICILIELLPEHSSSSRSKSEKILLLIKLLCDCAEGRQALVGHSMGIPGVSKTLLHVSNAATKIGVKILWLICSCHPTERVLEEMLIYGSVKKLLTLLLIGGRSSTKDMVVKMFKLHANSWRRYPCFPYELNQYLGLVTATC